MQIAGISKIRRLILLAVEFVPWLRMENQRVYLLIGAIELIYKFVPETSDLEMHEAIRIATKDARQLV